MQQGTVYTVPKEGTALVIVHLTTPPTEEEHRQMVERWRETTAGMVNPPRLVVFVGEMQLTVIVPEQE